MFYEQPSMKSILDGFFSTKGKTKNDIKALFGFDSVHTGLPYNMLQACTLKFFEQIAKEPNKDKLYHFGQYLTAFDSIIIGLVFKDYNNAEFIIYLDNKNKYVLGFNYRTDNFPSVSITMPEGKTIYIRHLTINQKVINDCGVCVPTESILTIINGLIYALTDMLFRAYEVYHEHD